MYYTPSFCPKHFLFMKRFFFISMGLIYLKTKKNNLFVNYCYDDEVVKLQIPIIQYCRTKIYRKKIFW